MLGVVIVFVRISMLLARYDATNNMIKDTNFTVRKDNSPIDEDKSVNGINFYGSSDTQDRAISDPKEIRKELIEDIRNAQKEAYSNNTRLYNNVNDKENAKQGITVLIFLFVFFAIIITIKMSEWMVQQANNESDDIYANYYDYLDNSEELYEDTGYYKYYFQNGVSIDIPNEFELIGEYKYILNLKGQNDSTIAMGLFDKDSYDLDVEKHEQEDFHRLLVCDELGITSDAIEVYYKIIGRRAACYSYINYLDEFDNDKYSIIYTVNLKDKYFVFADLGTDYIDYNSYEYIISTLNEE